MKNLFWIPLLLCLACSESEQSKASRILQDSASSILVKAVTDAKAAGITIPTDSLYLQLAKADPERKIPFADSVDQVIRGQIAQVKAEKAEQRKANQKEFDQLKAKFTYKKDEFQDIGFYNHKRWGNYWPNRTTLTAGVNSSGYAWLNSNYHADDWLFHTKITVLIGEDKYQSATVPSYNDNNRRENEGGKVWEVITYENEKAILRAISSNVDKTIKVRFTGDKYYHDITLRSGDKQAIAECYRLAELITSLAASDSATQ